VTCFINEFGNITHNLLDENGSQYTEGVLTGQVAVPVQQELTFYVRHGELFAEVCVGLSALVLVVMTLQFVRRRKS
jgi:apolipoprotein N-acyltransferase